MLLTNIEGSVVAHVVGDVVVDVGQQLSYWWSWTSAVGSWWSWWSS